MRIDYLQNNGPLIPRTLKECYSMIFLKKSSMEWLPDMDIAEEILLLHWI